MILSTPDPAADPHFAQMLLSMQRSAFRIEADLMGVDMIPPLRETLDDLAAFRGRWVTAWDGTALVGAAAWAEGATLEIQKVVVHPDHHRRGIAKRLLERVIEHSAGRAIEVTTGRDNPPGRAMYAKVGFEVVGDELHPPDVWLTRMRRPGVTVS